MEFKGMRGELWRMDWMGRAGVFAFRCSSGSEEGVRRGREKKWGKVVCG